ncbi:MAG: hypothetical protein ACRDI2_00170 [Chloroflexota bacterium]
MARLADLDSAPLGLTRDALEVYDEIARRAIAAGRDNLGVQALRREIIARLLASGLY